MGIVLFWLAIGILCAAIAPSRGRSAGAWFCLGFLLSPLALVALLALPNLKDEQEKRIIEQADERAALDNKECPRCAETIKYAAKVCRFCGHEFTEAPSTTDEDDGSEIPLLPEGYRLPSEWERR